MRVYSIITLLFVLFTNFTGALQATPASEQFEVDISERDLNSFVSGLLNGHIVADVVSHIDFEKIAGYAEDILTSGDNIKYLDDLLIGLKDTNIIPKLAVKLVTSNKTLPLVEKAVPELLSIVGKINATTFFVALDRSGLAYSVVAGTLEDPNLLPALLNVSRNLISSAKLNYTAILGYAGKLISRDLTELPDNYHVRELADMQFDERDDIEEYYQMMYDFDKRDNIEELLSTVLGSVERSGLINETITTLLTDHEFTEGAEVLIQGVLEDLGSEIKGVNFTSILTILHALWDSKLLQHTLTRALNDSQLISALEKDLGTLLKKGTITKKDLIGNKAQSVSSALSATTAEGSAFNSLASGFDSFAKTKTTSFAPNSVYPSQASSSASSSKSGSGAAAGTTSGTPLITLIFGMFSMTALMML